jgi:hypothetical protein
MCVFKQPQMPAPDPSIEAERKERMAQETADKASRRDTALEETVRKKKKGTGTRSLLTSSSGGIGYYNRDV